MEEDEVEVLWAARRDRSGERWRKVFEFIYFGPSLSLSLSVFARKP